MSCDVRVLVSVRYNLLTYVTYLIIIIMYVNTRTRIVFTCISYVILLYLTRFINNQTSIKLTKETISGLRKILFRTLFGISSRMMIGGILYNVCCILKGSFMARTRNNKDNFCAYFGLLRIELQIKIICKYHNIQHTSTSSTINI